MRLIAMLSELSWKTARYVLLIYPPVIAIVILFWKGFHWLSCGMAVAVTAFLFAAPLWTAWWIRNFELPAARQEARAEASTGHCDVLFLRPFEADRYWGGLQEFLLEVVRAYNSQYAAFKTIVALGRDDDGAIAKLASTDEHWLEELTTLGARCDAIILLPIRMDPQPTSGIVREIVTVLVAHADKAIFVMPPSRLWDRNLKGTPLAGHLGRLWTEMKAMLHEAAPSLPFPAYKTDGCFWTASEGPHGWQSTDYTYSTTGAAAVLFNTLDSQRVKRDAFLLKWDPAGWAALQSRKRVGKDSFPFDDMLV